MHANRTNIASALTQYGHRCVVRRGYVLLTTVAVLVLAVIVLTGIVRQSLARIVAANTAQDELQLKWGAISCRQALLPHAKQIMDAANVAEATASVRGQVRLGKFRYTLAVADESAKANPNAMLRDGRRRGDVEQSIREGLRGSGLGNHIRLDVPLSGNPWPIGSFAQMLNDVPPGKLLEQKQGGIAAADLLTCWSDGRINLLRAGEPALQAALTSKLTGVQISDLLHARTKLFETVRATQTASAGATSRPSDAVDLSTPSGRAQAAAKLMQAIPSSAGIAPAQLFCDTSTCYSAWIVAEDSRMRTCELTVMEAADPRHPKYWSFAW